MMLTDTELEDGGVRRFLKPRAAARTVAGLARHPRRTARDAGGLGLELARVSAGRSDDTLRFRQGQWLSPVLRDWCDAGAESRKTDDDGSPCARGCCARVLASRYGSMLCRVPIERMQRHHRDRFRRRAIVMQRWTGCGHVHVGQHSSKEVDMALSDQLTELAARAKEAEDRAAAAQGQVQGRRSGGRRERASVCSGAG